MGGMGGRLGEASLPFLLTTQASWQAERRESSLPEIGPLRLGDFARDIFRFVSSVVSVRSVVGNGARRARRSRPTMCGIALAGGLALEWVGSIFWGVAQADRAAVF